MQYGGRRGMQYADLTSTSKTKNGCFHKYPTKKKNLCKVCKKKGKGSKNKKIGNGVRSKQQESKEKTNLQTEAHTIKHNQGRNNCYLPRVGFCLEGKLWCEPQDLMRI